MKVWLTQIRAIDPLDDELKTWTGPRIMANTWEEAEDKLEAAGMSYVEVIGELKAEVNYQSGITTNYESLRKNWDDPLELLGDDAKDFDKFCEWLDIAKDETDFGLQSYLATYRKLVQYKHKAHAKIVKYYINVLKYKNSSV